MPVSKKSFGFGYYDTYGNLWLAYKNKEQAEAPEQCVICHKDISKELPKVDIYGNHYCGECYSDKCKKELLQEKLVKSEIVEFPCKVGDTVWYINYGYCYPNLKSHLQVKPIIVTEISWKHDRSGKDLGFALIANGTRYKFSSIGKTVFLTKSEAERRLAELTKE